MRNQSKPKTPPFDQEHLRSLLDYDPDTGVLTWKPREVRRGFERTDKCWNTAWSGKAAGTMSDGYIQIAIGYGRQYRAHRLAWFWMTGEWPDVDVEHADVDRSNNRWGNLRLATRSENLANAPKRKDNTSGFKGVTWHVAARKWRAKIQVEGKSVYLGLFATREEAAAAYEAAAREHFGKFARTS